MMKHIPFKGQNLCGRSFKGQDLTGADFSNCDLRGASFVGADLTGANFSQARMGRTRWASFILFLWRTLLGLTAGFLPVFFNWFLEGIQTLLRSFNVYSLENVWWSAMSLAVLLAMAIMVATHAHRINYLLLFWGLMGGWVLVATGVENALLTIFAGLVAVAWMLAVATVGAGYAALFGALLGVLGQQMMGIGAEGVSLSWASGWVCCIFIALGMYLQQRAVKHKETTPRALRIWVLKARNLFGTNFSFATLKGVDFSHANLAGACFIHAHIEGCAFQQAKNVNLASFD